MIETQTTPPAVLLAVPVAILSLLVQRRAEPHGFADRANPVGMDRSYRTSAVPSPSIRVSCPRLQTPRGERRITYGGEILKLMAQCSP